MRIPLLLTPFLFLTAVAHAGVSACPNFVYDIFPIAGATGVASSCGAATVTPTYSYAYSPGEGSVAIDVLAAYVGYPGLTAYSVAGIPGEGSAVGFLFSNGIEGANLHFNYSNFFEESSAGRIFYVFNDVFYAIDTFAAGGGEAAEGTTIEGSINLTMQGGVNALFIGSYNLLPIGVSSLQLDPSVTITNLAVTSNSVPEPATLGLTGLALAGVAFFSRRKR